MLSRIASRPLAKQTWTTLGRAAGVAAHGPGCPCCTVNKRGLADYSKGYDNILVDVSNEGVGLITLNRPKALNALCDALLDDLIDATEKMDKDGDIGCIVITGSEKAFAAGADIKEMKDKQFAEVLMKNMFKNWGKIAELEVPTIAAVNGFALGGGCELAMSCDIMLAGDRAKFGQPEINLGVIPGCGGTQRLTRAIGRSKSMMYNLTGEMFGAEQAERDGLVAKVFPAGELVGEAVKMGGVIASKGRIASKMAKEAVDAVDQLSLAEGLRLERRLFHGLFATNDQKEGMAAFAEKRKAEWTHS